MEESNPVKKTSVDLGNKTNGRVLRAQAMLAGGDKPTPVGQDMYRVPSPTDAEKSYEVSRIGTTWRCTCADAVYRLAKCKHAWLVELTLALKHAVQTRQVISALNTSVCKFCQSASIVRDALRHNKYGDIQRYFCRDCGRRFSTNLGFEGMRATPQAINKSDATLLSRREPEEYSEILTSARR